MLFPRMRLQGQRELEELAREVAAVTTYDESEVVGMVQALSRRMAKAMAEGWSVKIGGMGVFTPALGLRKGKERETDEGRGTRRNANSICISRIHFKADKRLIKETDNLCRLERTTERFRTSSERYSPAERLALAQAYLAEHGYMTVGDYAALTGLLRDAAAKELRRWKADEASGLTSQGRGSHKVYVKR